MTKEQAISAHMLIYTVCYDIELKARPVDKVLKQIKKGLRKLDISKFDRLTNTTHEAWERARKKIITNSSQRETVQLSEMLMSIYNDIPCKYKNIYYTDKNFTSMVNSFESCRNTVKHDDRYVLTGRGLADAFLDEIGVVKTNKFTSIMRRIRND